MWVGMPATTGGDCERRKLGKTQEREEERWNKGKGIKTGEWQASRAENE